MMEGKENSAMTILMDFAKPCKGKLIGSVVLAVLGALCGMIPYIAVSRGIIMICHEDYAFSKSGIDCFCGLSRAGVVRNFFYNEKP